MKVLSGSHSMKAAGQIDFPLLLSQQAEKRFRLFRAQLPFRKFRSVSQPPGPQNPGLQGLRQRRHIRGPDPPRIRKTRRTCRM